jgi:alcohol dehydrogenase
MRELTFVEPRLLAWRDVADPRLQGPRDALVRPLAVAACDLDPVIVHGRTPFAGPFPLGHEFAGEVVEAGPAARVRPGDRVVVPFHISCGDCDRCRRGLTSSCRTAPPGAMFGMGAIGGNFGGALADLVRVPFADFVCEPVPAGVATTTVASASDNIPDAWRATAPYLEETPGASVLIMGGASSGSIGLYAVDVAVALGSSTVDYVDTDPRRLEIAQELGAHPVEGPPPRRLGSHPITFDASSDPAGLACALRSTEPGGVCTSAGIYFTETAMPLLDMFARGVTFRTGRPHVTNDLARILALVAEGRLHPDRVTTTIAPWDEAAEALLAHDTGKLVIERA